MTCKGPLKSFREGRVLDLKGNYYKVHKLVAEGAFSKIFVCSFAGGFMGRASPKKLAAKVVETQKSASSKTLDDIRVERKIWKCLLHPNIG